VFHDPLEESVDGIELAFVHDIIETNAVIESPDLVLL
jgi:hypothetical protein